MEQPCPRNYMEVRSHIHAPVAFTPKERHADNQSDKRMDGPQSQSERCGDEKFSLTTEH
jgi:hypothetical protein